MTRAVVNVATGRFVKGQERLRSALPKFAGSCELRFWNGGMPRLSPPHESIPYAFKAFALRDAMFLGADLLLWCDASILPVRSLEPLWERIERDGYWFSKNGWSNYQWTADSAYAELMPGPIGRNVNKQIPHVVATAFGLNVRHPKGKAFLDEYYRLASETRAFCGPWKNTPETPCGPPDVLGHRHDQTAASVIAWRLGMELTSPPDIFAYANPEGSLPDERTILVADGNY